MVHRCQVVAMSESTCHNLGLAYNPSIKLNMKSANGKINQSLGLTHNVPFQIEPVRTLGNNAYFHSQLLGFNLSPSTVI